MRLIDKSKPSNRRCCNCVGWKGKTPLPPARRTPSAYFLCPRSRRPMEYWSVCPMFKWDPDRHYKQDLKGSDPL